VLVTRVDLVIAAAVDVPGAEHDERARLLTWRPAAAGDFTVAVVTAGISDGPVADEIAAIARAIGLRVQEIRDAGVAGDPRVAGSRAGYRQPGGRGDGNDAKLAVLGPCQVVILLGVAG
jgi:pyridinium-3,5-biscarboxylic acid mononucleotide synthase